LVAGSRSVSLTKAAALAILRAAARDSGLIVFTDHAIRRMRERHITRTQVMRCLGTGRIAEGPAPAVRGGWTCRVEGLAEGRGLAVAVALDPPKEDVIVITGFWTD
jgi:hypothetical protein